MKLSILTATYNRGKYLQKLYDSIKENLKYNQNCEWIIVDDGSTDDTKTFVKNLKMKILYQLYIIIKKIMAKCQL